MRIATVEAFMSAANWRNYVFVRLRTDEGLVGWGEATLGWKEPAVVETVLDFGRRYVVGRSPFDIEDLWFSLYQVEHNVGPVMFSAMAGIEMAMWDIVGKALGQPIHNLVGGKLRSHVKVYANGWYKYSGDTAKLAAQAQEVVGRGYGAIKFDPFGPGGKARRRHARLPTSCAATRGWQNVR